MPCEECYTTPPGQSCTRCGETYDIGPDLAWYFDDLYGMFHALDDWSRTRELPEEVGPVLTEYECPRCGKAWTSKFSFLPTLPRCDCDPYELTPARFKALKFRESVKGANAPPTQSTKLPPTED